MRDKPVIEFTDDELEQALSGELLGPLGLEDPTVLRPEVEPSSELVEVSRRIAGQYVEVLATFGASAFGKRLDRAACEEVVNALESLERLAVASADLPQLELLHALRVEIERVVHDGPRSVSDRFLTRLRRWFEEYGECLSGADQERLRRLVTYARGSIPLLAEIATIKGMGPKRLQRLYCAGLYTVEVVANADPQEVAQVTGLPRHLAFRVVDATREYAVSHRRRCVVELHARVEEVEHITSLSHGRLDAELLVVLRDAAERLSACVARVRPILTTHVVAEPTPMEVT